MKRFVWMSGVAIVLFGAIVADPGTGRAQDPGTGTGFGTGGPGLESPRQAPAGETSGAGGSFTAAPGGPPGTPLSAETPEASPGAGPAPYGVGTTGPLPPPDIGSGTPGGTQGSQLPGPAGSQFPRSEGELMGQEGTGTGTDSTLGGSGTGAGGFGEGARTPGNAGTTDRP